MGNLFVDTSSEDYEKKLIQAYENITGRTLNPADPERLILDVITYAITVISFNIEYTGKQNLLAYATDDRLDSIAQLYGIERLQPKPAITTIEFTIESAVDYDIVINKGTLVAAGNVYFSTIDESIIKAGTTSISVQAECTEPGEIGNGFLPGQINAMVNPIPLVKATNTTMSMYGADIEDDERFRERIRLSLERFSVAGPKKAYEYWAKTAHQDVTDVNVVSSEPGVVNIYLLANNSLPTDDIIEYVQDFISDDKIRPLTDKVIVSAPNTISYDIDITYYIHSDKSAFVSDIENSVNESIDDFLNFTSSKIGRDVLQSDLIKRIIDAGAYRVDVASPSYTSVDPTTVAQINTKSVNYGGLVDD